MPEDEEEWWDVAIGESDYSNGAIHDLEADLCQADEEYCNLTTAELHERLDALIAQEESNGG